VKIFLTYLPVTQNYFIKQAVAIEQKLDESTTGGGSVNLKVIKK
jgi:hypothetical protein